MLHVWIGRARTGKSDRVLRRIRELGDESQQILLVPEHASHQAEVDLCRVCGGTASRHSEVLSFRRLGDRVLSITGGLAETPLDAGGELLTLQRCVSALSPSLSVYRRPSQKPAFLRQMLDLFTELRSYEVTPEILASKAEGITGATRDKLLDLSLLYAAYEARLRQDGRDLRDRMSRLCDHLEESGYVRGKDVFLDGFTYFNAQERRVLSVLLRQSRSVTVTLLGEAGSREEIFAPALKALGQLERLAREAGCPMETEPMEREAANALDHMERYFFSGTHPYQGDFPAGEGAPVRVREAENALSEVERTAADILRLVAEGKARFRDIGVTARNMADYEAAIETVFARWEIPVYLNRRTDILEKPVLSLLTGVLAAVTGGYEYEEMFRWLKTGLAGLAPEECDVLENYVLKWEIHGGMWLRDTAWTEHPEGYGQSAMSEEQEKRLEQVNALRQRVRLPLAALAEGLRRGGSAREKVEALYGFMERLGLQAALEAQMRDEAAAGRLQEAEETAQLWEILCLVLDEFVEILGDEPLDTDTFERLFRQALTQYSVGTIPVSLDQVSAGELTRNDRHTVRYLFFLGVNDHVIPAPGQGGGILNEDDRAALAQSGVELAPTGEEQMRVELHNLYAALAKPEEGLVVSYPVRGAGGEELRPAFVVERLLALFPALRVERGDGAYRLTAKIPALEAAGSEIGGPLWRYLEENGGCAGQLAAMERAAALRRGALSRRTVRFLYGDRIALSASRLERLRTCHFAYFMQYGLRAKSRTPASFDALQIGSFLHYLLQHVSEDVKRRGGFAQVEPSTLRKLTDHHIQRYIQETFGDLSRKNARFRYLFNRLRRTARNVVEQAAEELAHSDFVPVAFELSFGDQGEIPAVVITEPDGELRVGGRVDRVDGWIKGEKLYLRVVDYKSGQKKFDLKEVRMGLDIQLLLYLFALQKGGAAHFGREIEPAGVLYLPIRDEILSAERNISPEELVKKRENALRRTGLLLSEPEVLQAMEHEALTAPHFLPMDVAKDGSLSGSLASASRMGKLGRYVERLIREIGREIRQGNIDADPCCPSRNEDPCQYCDWTGACHFQDGRDRDRVRYLAKVTPEEFWKEVEEE